MYKRQTSYKIQIITTRYDGVIKEALTAVMGFDDIEVIYLFKPQETDDEKEQSDIYHDYSKE